MSTNIFPHTQIWCNTLRYIYIYTALQIFMHFYSMFTQTETCFHTCHLCKYTEICLYFPYAQRYLCALNKWSHKHLNIHTLKYIYHLQRPNEYQSHSFFCFCLFVCLYLYIYSQNSPAKHKVVGNHCDVFKECTDKNPTKRIFLACYLCMLLDEE